MFRRWRKEWAIVSATFGGNQYLLDISRGWEPFAITETVDSLGLTVTTVWLKKRVRV